MSVINHKVYLYKPDGTSFLGELIVDNLKADIKLQDISTLSFRIPEVINGQVNPRVDEVLDSYIIELWYGKVDGVYANGDFEKIKFRIYSTPLEFADYQYLHSYTGYSIQSDLEFKQIVSWHGIQVKDFFRTITYNESAGSPLFTETGFNYSISTSSNTSSTKYITIDTTDEPTALDIFIYEKRTNSATSTESEVALIELTTGGVNSNDFKSGYYYLNKTGDIVNSVNIALPANYTSFNGAATAQLFYRFYDNPVARAFAVGIKTNTEQPLSNMYIDLAQDAASGASAEYEGYTFTTQSIYSKNGLKLNDILTGADTAADGILYNTGFTVSTISNTIAAKYRSNIDFNNITVYQAIKDIAESFDAIAVFDTVNKTVSFYAENEYGSNNDLVIKYATYLKSINKEIDASKIITNARGLGKDNIKISLVNPTGLEVWEDYSYFLDDYYIEDTSNFATSPAGFTIIADGTNGLTITYPSTAGFQSRWMDVNEAIKVGKWQYTKDYFHYVFSNHDANVFDASHNTYKGLYLKRSEAINLYVKYETQYEKKKADEYKYYYLLEHYRDLYENKGTNLAEYQYYQTKYATVVAQSADFKSTVLDPAYTNIYDETSVGSLAYKFAAVRSFLNKTTNRSIDLDKLRTFQREVVHNDSKIDTEEDLVEATKIYVDENKEPRITFNISIIDVLEAQEAYQDWDKFVIGDKINIYFPEFNVDLEAQIREISIDFQGKTLSIVISTVRNYNRSFGNYLTKNLRRFHNANMNTVLYYKDGTDASITQTETVRATLHTGINAGDTSVNTGATDGSTGESSTTTDGEGQKSRVVTGVDLYTETLTLGAFTTGVKINDGRLLTFKPFNVSGTQWVQEVEVSAENGFVIRRVYANDVVTKLAYIDADGSAFFAGWRLEPGQFSAGVGASFVGINSETPVVDNTLYAFWAGSVTASSAAFNVTKAGAIKATAGTIAGLSVGTAYVSTADKSATTNPKNAIFKRSAGGAGVWGENETSFYLDEDGRFSLSNELTWNPTTNTFFVNGTIEATFGEIGGWTVAAEKLHAGSTTTYVELNADAASSYAIFAGNTTGATAPFSVTKNGALNATNATIEGAITANSGSIAGFTIENTVLTAGSLSTGASGSNVGLTPDSGLSNISIWAGASIASGTVPTDAEVAAAPFRVTKNGALTATSGTIGGFTITGTTIQQGSDTTKLALQSNGNNPFLTIGQATNGYGNDGVFLGIASTYPKFSMVTDSGNTFLKYDPSATYDLEIAGNAKIGPLFVGNNTSNITTLTSSSGLSYFTGDSVQIVNGVGFGFVTFNLTDTSGQEITGGTVNLSAYSGSNIIASISLYDQINTGGNLLATFDTEDLTTLGGSGGFLFSRNIRNVKRITVSVNSINILSTWTLPIANITVTSYKPSIQINNFTVNSTGELTSSKLTINTSTTVGRDAITILPAIVGTTYKNVVLSTPTGGLTLNRTVRLPDASGTIALNDAAQTFSAIKTFSAEPVFTAGAIFGSAADAANSIEITSSGNIIFEGSSADANETILTAANPTGDRTITIPDATGTIALMQSSTATMYIGRIWTRSYNNQTWTLRRDATLQVLPTDGTYQVFDLGYAIVDDSANADIIKVEIVGGTSSTSAGRAFVEVVAGTFQTTSGIAVLSYTAFDGVNGNIITPIQYLAQYRTNGNNFEVRRPTSIRMSGGA